MFEKVLQPLYEREQKRAILEIPFSDFHSSFLYDEEDIITVNDMQLNKQAFIHLCGFLNKRLPKNIATSYLWEYKDGISQLLPQHMDTYFESINDHLVKVLLNDDVITAIFSERYVDYSNYKLVKSFADYCDNNEMEPKAVSLKTFDDYYDAIQLTAIFNQYHTDHSIYGAGVMLNNSENKTRGLMFAPIVKSTACDNSIISFGSHRNRHFTGVNEFAENVINLTEELIDLAVKTYDHYSETANVRIDDMPFIIDYLVKHFNLSKAAKEKLIEGLNSERTDINDTLFNLISGLTYMANFIELNNYDEALRILLYSGELLQLSDKGTVTVGDIVLWD